MARPSEGSDPPRLRRSQSNGVAILFHPRMAYSPGEMIPLGFALKSDGQGSQRPTSRPGDVTLTDQRQPSAVGCNNAGVLSLPAAATARGDAALRSRCLAKFVRAAGYAGPPDGELRYWIDLLLTFLVALLRLSGTGQE